MSTTKNKFNVDFKKRFHKAVNLAFGEIKSTELKFKVQTGTYADGTTWTTRRCYISIPNYGIKGYVEKTNSAYCDSFGNSYGSGWAFKSGNSAIFNEAINKVKSNYENAR